MTYQFSDEALRDIMNDLIRLSVKNKEQAMGRLGEGKDRFDLEQEILDCWGICEDLDTVMEGLLEKDMSKDDVANALLGMKVLYNLKFDKMFLTFEEMIHTGKM